MDVSSHTFSGELVQIIQLIADSHFVALDLEFSGISSRRTRAGRSRLSLQQVYEETREAAAQYQILQVGLTVVEEDAQKGAYILRPYNFYINPVPAREDYHRLERVWSYQSGAVSFLLKNRFRFDLPFSDGIAYLSRKEERQIRASWAVRDAEIAALEDMVLKVDDKPLVDHIHLSVRKWLSQSLLEREDYLNIPHTTPESPRIKHLPAALNRYQIRLTHQIIRKDYANLKTLGKDGFVRITVRNEKEDAEQKLRQEQYREKDVTHSIEFRWLVEALCGGDITKIPEGYFLAAMTSDVNADIDDAAYKEFVDGLQQKLSTRRRVLFGHNCFTDLIYLYACFIADPPEKVEDFQELIHGLFPAVVDTKFLASWVNKLRFHSNLKALEEEMRMEELPAIVVPTAFDRYTWGEHFHEAGFDSFMTAKIGIKLSAKLEREERVGEKRKPQRIVKAGQITVKDPNLDAEDEEQSEEYVTASESAETESVVSVLASKLSGVFSAPSNTPERFLKPSAGKPLSETDSEAKPDLHADSKDTSTSGQIQYEADPEPAQSDADSAPVQTATIPSTLPTTTPIVAVKERVIDWRSPTEVKRIKNSFAHNNLFDILDTPVRPTSDRTPSTGQDNGREPSTTEVRNTDTPEPDALIWSDKEEEEEEREKQKEGDNESGDATSESVPIQADTPETPMTAQELEEKVNQMAAKGEMMPRWESESGIWKVIGNRLVVNACEEGVCIL